MRRLIGLGLVAAALSATGAAFAAGLVPGTDRASIRVAKILAGNGLKDPASATFRNVAAHPKGVCGEINGKNAYGGYAGFAPFVAPKGGAASIYPGDIDMDRINSAANFYVTSRSEGRASFYKVSDHVDQWCAFAEKFSDVCEVEDRLKSIDSQTCTNARTLIRSVYPR